MDIHKKDLRQYNGRNGNKAYIAHAKIVYDVSHIFNNGEHMSCLAGNDLTDILDLMPHGIEILEKAVVVGKLVD